MVRSSHPANQSVLSYFRFSRSQRRAMVILLLAAAALWVIIGRPRTNRQISGDRGFVATESLQALMAQSPGTKAAERSFSHHTLGKPIGNKPHEPASSTLNPFLFDPNTAGFEMLLALGLTGKAARNIINYREKGGRFTKPEDLSKMYSLSPGEAEKLMPFVKIEALPQALAKTEQEATPVEIIHSPPHTYTKPLPFKVNINKADSLTLRMLPGIGAKRASAIVAFREKLGGFISIEQVGETFGLPDSVFQTIISSLEWEPGQIRQLSLNTATEAELKAHPYIGWQWAKLIVAFRNQHGPYSTVEDLMKIHIMKKEWLEQVKPYLKTN